MAIPKDFKLQFSKWWLVVPCFVATCVLLFCLYYLFQPYNILAANYQATHGCFYRQTSWQKDFFTVTTKDIGNRYCTIGLILSALILSWGIFNLYVGKVFEAIVVRLYKNDLFAIAGLLLFGFGIWLWGFITALPSYDEVFSAMNCAGEGPMLSFTYYMLPNNHVLFNVLNSSLFAWAGNYIISGRIISGLAFAALIVMLYLWLHAKLSHKGYAILYCAVLMLQFPVWGFAFQARGYSLYLLCAWTSMIALERYLEQRNKTALVFHAGACIIGFAVMPTFLFWYASNVLVIAATFIYRRHINKQLFLTHVIVICCVYLFYLPILCYSGLPALTENEYVRVAHPTWPDFWANFKSGFDATIRYCFASDVDGHSPIYAILFAAPVVALPLIRKTRASLYILTGIGIWIIFFILQVRFRHYPFMRNMVAHCSMSLAVLLLALHFTVQKVFKKAIFKKWTFTLPVIFCASCAIHFIKYMNGSVNSGLYFYDAKGRYSDQKKLVSVIPKNASVWTSDESFFPRYLLKQSHASVSHCYSGQEYMISDKTINETLPVMINDVWKVDSANQYLLYKLK